MPEQLLNKSGNAGVVAADLPQASALSFPAADDWQGWIDLWCREDTGNIDCVPECLRHHVADLVTPEGWLKLPDTVPNTPYKIARWFHTDPANQPPWRGTGFSPDQVRDRWEEHLRSVEAEVAEPETEYADLYFIVSEGGPIKIGVSQDPVRRLNGLQTSNPHRLSIAAVVAAGALMEGDYHKRFAAHRLHGEWFSPAPEILAEITRLSTQGEVS